MKRSGYPQYKPSGVEWLGEGPVHWEITRLKNVASRVDQKVEADSENPMPYIGLEQVQSWTGMLLPLDSAIVPTSTADLFNNGDVLFGKLRPYLAKAVAPDLQGICSTELLVLTPKQHHRRFLMYQLLCEGFISLVDASAFGVKMPRAEWAFIGSCPMVAPPFAEQKGIADFLDAETAKLDTLVERQQALIERLKERRTALISRTVTHGLPPDAAHAVGLNPHPKLKPSGVEWLDEVPSHWKVVPFTKYVSDSSDYRGKTPEKTDDGITLVTARNVRMGFIDYEASQEFVAAEEYAEIMRRGLPQKGDVLFTTEAPLGNVALVDRADVALAQRIIRFRINPIHFVPRFTLFAMMSDFFQTQLACLATGSTAEGIKASKLPLLRLPAPPILEQQAIADYIDMETRRLDQLVAKAEGIIMRLQEYRRVLIAAAVTGKIDVRDGGA